MNKLLVMSFMFILFLPFIQAYDSATVCGDSACQGNENPYSCSSDCKFTTDNLMCVINDKDCSAWVYQFFLALGALLSLVGNKKFWVVFFVVLLLLSVYSDKQLISDSVVTNTNLTLEQQNDNFVYKYGRSIMPSNPVAGFIGALIVIFILLNNLTDNYILNSLRRTR